MFIYVYVFLITVVSFYQLRTSEMMLTGLKFEPWLFDSTFLIFSEEYLLLVKTPTKTSLDGDLWFPNRAFEPRTAETFFSSPGLDRCQPAGRVGLHVCRCIRMVSTGKTKGILAIFISWVMVLCLGCKMFDMFKTLMLFVLLYIYVYYILVFCS